MVGKRLEHSQVAAGEGGPDGGRDFEVVFVFDLEDVVVDLSLPDVELDDFHVLHVVLVVFSLEVHVDLDARDLQVAAELLEK